MQNTLNRTEQFSKPAENAISIVKWPFDGNLDVIRNLAHSGTAQAIMTSRTPLAGGFYSERMITPAEIRRILEATASEIDILLAPRSTRVIQTEYWHDILDETGEVTSEVLKIKNVSRAIMERLSLQPVRHKNIQFEARRQGRNSIDSFLITVTEFAEQFKSLDSLVNSGASKELIYKIVLDALEGGIYIADQLGLVHSDINPKNIHLNGNKGVISDLESLSRVVTDQTKVIDLRTAYYDSSYYYESNKGLYLEDDVFAWALVILYCARTEEIRRTFADVMTEIRCSKGSDAQRYARFCNYVDTCNVDPKLAIALKKALHVERNQRGTIKDLYTSLKAFTETS
jgi:serine/threonine protein kinase